MSSASTNSVLLELIELSFLFVDVMMVDNYPGDWVSPMCTLKWVRTSWYPSNHHLKMMVLCLRRVSGISGVPRRYLIMWTSLFQSYSSGAVNCVIRNDTAVCMYGLYFLAENSFLKYFCYKYWILSSQEQWHYLKYWIIRGLSQDFHFSKRAFIWEHHEKGTQIYQQCFE